MIRLYGDTSPPAQQFLNDITGVKLAADLAAYGTGHSFSLFWTQEMNGVITAWLHKLENTMFVVAAADADYTELCGFCAAIGFDSLQTAADTACHMGLATDTVYTVLLHEPFHGVVTPDAALTTIPPLRQVYDTLFADHTGFAPAEWTGWYADLSHRLRHGCAQMVATKPPKACGAAVAAHVIENAAVISGVAVAPQAQCHGLGSRLLLALLGQLDGRRVFVGCLPALEPFYIHNEFAPVAQLAVCKR